MKFIIGKKIEMTQRFAEDGSVVPVTIVEAGPCIVSQVKTAERDGYSAVQVGFGTAKKLSKAERGHMKNLGAVKHLREFRMAQMPELKRGDTITAAVFVPGDLVTVRGISKGKGFQGVVRRHGFSGSLATHGHKDQLRMPGSIGSTDSGRVFKGTRMGGHMGSNSITLKNLAVVEVNAEKNLLYIRGAVPGSRGGLLVISTDGVMNLSVPPSAGNAVKKGDADGKQAAPQKGQGEIPAKPQPKGPSDSAEKQKGGKSKK